MIQTGKVTGIQASPYTNYARLELDSKTGNHETFRFEGGQSKAPYVYAICLASMINGLRVEVTYEKDAESKGIVKSIRLIAL